MKTKFSKHWKSSKQIRKQRKYRFNAPKHIQKRFLASMLSKELKKKYNKNAIVLKKGDMVKIMRGENRKKTGKVSKVNMKKSKAYIEGITNVKKDGSKIQIPIHTSNLMITELNLEDKFRRKSLERK
ncbi:MAG TPA: 50S ribosomal protein L24 [Candidatus Nanoarchaeia archaeon]|nr:hypothetical protein [uncultured archaeon]AQS34174.1 hypothetical protein [uncultured archaeon]HLC56552.1 50S ribosomal protein L24 [Candidatus Nanoarchaeia archaeon]